MNNYCNARTTIGLNTGTLGRCELRSGHIGPHQEQRQDNGTPRQWPNRDGAA